MLEVEKTDKENQKNLFKRWFTYFVKQAQYGFEFENSTLYAFIGERRSGKSVTALAMCKAIDPDFSTDQIVFTSKDLMKLIKDPNYRRKAILWDEASVTAYSRDFMQEMNKTLNKVFQVFGYRQLAINMTLQHINFLDKHTRTLVNTLFRCNTKIDFEKRAKLVFLEPMSIVCDWVRDPIIVPYKVPMNGRFVELRAIPLPPAEELFKFAGVDEKLYNDYLKMKEEFFVDMGAEKADKEKELVLEYVQVECPRCGRRWPYRGRSDKVKCPSCGRYFRLSE